MELKRPHPRAHLSIRLYALTAALPATGLSWILARLSFLPSWVWSTFTALWGCALLLLLVVYLPLRYRHARFGVDDNHIAANSGVVFRVTRRMPLSGVRHVTILSGPLERRWHFAFVLVSGAGGWVLLEGVNATEAQELVHRLSGRGQV